NDDAIRSCSLVTKVIADAIEAGKAKVTPAEMAAPAEPSDLDQEEPEIQEGKPTAERLARESADEEIADESPGEEVPTGVAAQAAPSEPSQAQPECPRSLELSARSSVTRPARGSWTPSTRCRTRTAMSRLRRRCSASAVWPAPPSARAAKPPRARSAIGLPTTPSVE